MPLQRTPAFRDPGGHRRARQQPDAHRRPVEQQQESSPPAGRLAPTFLLPSNMSLVTCVRRTSLVTIPSSSHPPRHFFPSWSVTSSQVIYFQYPLPPKKSCHARRLGAEVTDCLIRR